MNVLLLGATGFTGREVLQQLLSTDHQLTLLVRNRQRLPALPDTVRIVEGSVLDTQDLSTALDGQEAVINCLGIGGKGSGQPNTFLSESAALLVQQMTALYVPRLIALSNVGAGDSAAFSPWYFRRLILPLFLGWLQHIIDDKNRLEALVQHSGLRWTLVRCPNILDRPSAGPIQATTTGEGLRQSIPNPDVATFLIQQLESEQFIHQAPCISRI